MTFARLARFGLTFDPAPGAQALTMPGDFAMLFPGSQGAIYGRSPHGLMAALQRPQARTAVPGLYLAGGGTHPGAGVPMAALSGKFAAQAVLRDHGSTGR
jgi:1-hydroxycarotenoid 3,4-desaturase